MQSPEIPTGSIVVGVDGSPSSARAVTWSVEQAVAERRPLVLAHGMGSVENHWMGQSALDHRVVLAARREEARRVVDAARAQVSQRAPDLAVHEALRAADPRQLLIELGTDAALLVLGSHGRGPVTSLLLGSVSVAVTRHATCPVVVVRLRHTEQGPGGVLAGTDGGERSRHTLEFAHRQASLRGLPLTIMHCYWDARSAFQAARLARGGAAVPAPDVEEVRMLVAESMAGLAAKFPEVDVRVELVHGWADDCLIDASRTMDLVVVGAHRRRALSNLVYGSVAFSVLEHASSVVALVPDPVDEQRPEPA
jgi:nucleotide-binding universal stress UspA family protein